MVDLLSQTWQEITARPDGPLAMRFYLQPLMATLLAVRDGVKDAREARPAYLWAVVSTPEHRRELLRSGWRSIGKVFLIALVLDVVYQLLVLRGLRPLEGLIIAVTLAIVPYALVRGPVNRLVRSARGGSAPKGKPA
jgi:hypothetical protein